MASNFLRDIGTFPLRLKKEKMERNWGQFSSFLYHFGVLKVESTF